MPPEAGVDIARVRDTYMETAGHTLGRHLPNASGEVPRGHCPRKLAHPSVVAARGEEMERNRPTVMGGVAV